MQDTPPTQAQQAVTQLLERAQGGDARVTDELFPIVYDELRAIAARYLNAEGRPQTLQATALVHEAYLRLVGPSETPWENRAHQADPDRPRPAAGADQAGGWRGPRAV